MMSGEENLGDLNTQQYDRLEEVASRLEEAWKAGGNIELDQYLPADGDTMRGVILVELIKTDLECRWNRGIKTTLDHYLRKHPELATRLNAELIFEEYRIRQRLGDKPELESYQKRYPDHFSDLKGIIAEMSAPATRADPRATEKPTAAGLAGVVLKDSVVNLTGGYNLIRRLGAGGFGEVWLAEAPGGILKAIKVIFRPLDHDEAKRETESLELIKKTRHHFLMPTHMYWPSQDRLFILMDVADGSLRDRLNECLKNKKSSVPLPDLIRYMKQSAEALDYLHERGIQHRDIKPENILLVEGNVRVADFGLARAQGTRRLISGSGAGTPLYMPPEVWNDKFHPNSDQYSLAATYVELRLGRRMFDASGFASLMQAHLGKTPNLEPLDQAEIDVLLRALAKRPEDRYATCEEFVRELEIAVAGEMADITGKSSYLTNVPSSTPSNAPTDQLNTLMPGQLAAHIQSLPDTQRELGAPSWIQSVTSLQQQRPKLFAASVAFFLLGVALLGWAGMLLFFAPSTFEPDATSYALTVAAGEQGKLGVSIRRDNFDEPVTLSFAADDDVQIARATIAADKSSAEVEVAVRPETPPGVKKIAFEATAGDIRKAGTLELTIAPLTTLPRASQAGSFRPLVGSEKGRPIITTLGGKPYYQNVECVVAGINPVRFVLIPAQPNPFYMMRDKVTNALYARYFEGHPHEADHWKLGTRVSSAKESVLDDDGFGFMVARLSPDPWTSTLIAPLYGQLEYYMPHAHDLGLREVDWPVFRVDIQAAHRFAEWLGGSLPSADEWDKAAGRLEKDRGAGPFGAKWGPGEIAIGRKHLGPLPVGTAKDTSPFGIRDMSGNGLEWTRTLQGSAAEYEGSTKSISPTAKVTTRGQDFTHRNPLQFSDIDNDLTRSVDFWPSQRIIVSPQINAHIGFRVVVSPAR